MCKKEPWLLVIIQKGLTRGHGQPREKGNVFKGKCMFKVEEPSWKFKHHMLYLHHPNMLT